MPQELHVLRCYSCETFQVDIVKKVNKWTCKVCGEKQSLNKVYATGTGKECRILVQSLNEQRHLRTVTPETPEAQFTTSNEILQQSSNAHKQSQWVMFTQNVTQNKVYSPPQSESFTQSIPQTQNILNINQSNLIGHCCSDSEKKFERNASRAISDSIFENKYCDVNFDF